MRQQHIDYFEHQHFYGLGELPRAAFAPCSKLEADLMEECALLRAERDAARRALGRTGDDRAQFVANMSHELRTPLNAILGYADMLLMDDAHVSGSPAARRYVESIREAGSHLLSIVDSVLDLSRLRAGSLELAETDIAPRDIIASVLRVLAPIADRASITLVDKSRTGLPLIHVDPQVIRQILINLISNAIKASPAGEQVCVRAQVKANGTLQFDVRDNGPGMAPEILDHVMQPYAQAEKATGFGAPGAGLGLPLVRSLAELHDGRFQLVSNVGRGTRAIITLPSSRVCTPAMPGQQVEFAFTRPTPLLVG